MAPLSESLAAKLGTGDQFYPELRRISTLAKRHGYTLEHLWIIADCPHATPVKPHQRCAGCAASFEFLTATGWLV